MGEGAGELETCGKSTFQCPTKDVLEMSKAGREGSYRKTGGLGKKKRGDLEMVIADHKGRLKREKGGKIFFEGRAAGGKGDYINGQS